MSKTQEKVLRDVLVAVGWVEKWENSTRAPLNDVQTHSYLKASIEAEKYFPWD